MTDGFLLFGSHDLRDRSRTNDSRTRVHRLTNRFNSTFRPTKRTFGSRSYIIVEQKVLFVRRVAQETEQNYRIQGRGRDGARSSFFDFPGTHRTIFFVKCFKVLACHDWHDYYIFLKEGTSVITQRFQCLLSDDLLRPRFSFWQDSWQKLFFGARSNFTGVAQRSNRVDFPFLQLFSSFLRIRCFFGIVRARR